MFIICCIQEPDNDKSAPPLKSWFCQQKGLQVRMNVTTGAMEEAKMSKGSCGFQMCTWADGSTEETMEPNILMDALPGPSKGAKKKPAAKPKAPATPEATNAGPEVVEAESKGGSKAKGPAKAAKAGRAKAKAKGGAKGKAKGKAPGKPKLPPADDEGEEEEQELGDKDPEVEEEPLHTHTG